MTFPYAVNLRFKKRGTKKLTEDKLLLRKKFLFWITSKNAIIFFIYAIPNREIHFFLLQSRIKLLWQSMYLWLSFFLVKRYLFQCIRLFFYSISHEYWPLTITYFCEKNNEEIHQMKIKKFSGKTTNQFVFFDALYRFSSLRPRTSKVVIFHHPLLIWRWHDWTLSTLLSILLCFE